MEDLIDIFAELEDEDFETEAPRTRGPTIVRNRIDYFNEWDEVNFFMKFRMTKRTANIVLDLIRDSIVSNTDKNRAISPEVKLLTTLHFYASGNFLNNVGDHIGIHYSTCSKVVKHVSKAIARLCPYFVSMPTGEELNKVKLGFYEHTRFPNCVGALDCTHVKILSPVRNNAELYRNRNGSFSLNVQVVCDSNLKFRNIVARWPGSTHDAHVFASCKLRQEFEQGLYGNGLVIGDSEYESKHYLITPLHAAVSDTEHLFQESIAQTNKLIEKCIEVWKNRFPVLALGLRLKIETIQAIIVATAVLQNICISEGEDDPPVIPEDVEAIEGLQEENSFNGVEFTIGWEENS